MPLPDLILALDYGTQSVRAVLFDPAGRTVARAQHDVEPYRSPRPGWAEMDAERFWEALAGVCRTLWAEPGADPARVRAVALATQRNTVVCLDREGRPLRPAILWPDQRRVDDLPPLPPQWRLAMGAAGLGGTIAQLRAQARSNWLARHEPELWGETAKFVLLSGWLTWRLTGRMADSVGAQVGYLPFDYRRQRWSGRRDWRWRALELTPDLLPELVPVGRQIGAMSEPASRETGIPRGIPLVAAASDKACEVIGSGAVEPHVAALSYGTTATVNVTHRRWVEPFPFLPSYPSALPGAYSAEVQIARGFWMVRWFRDEFGHPELALADELGVEPEPLLDELVRSVPPGSDGLVLQPYWSPGVRQPGPEARGAVIGFGDAHTRAHLYRAILEGLAYGLREGTERLERRGGVPARELRVAGGGSRSDAVMQLTADIFARPATRPAERDVAALGAAMVAAAGVGLHADVPAAVRAMAHPGDTFTPDRATSRTYDQLYRGVYLPLYRRLRPLYRRIREISDRCR
ncbi:MAG TPA: FGGY-family carbohydrate kinase [Gemmatimonadales bacterium]